MNPHFHAERVRVHTEELVRRAEARRAASASVRQSPSAPRGERRRLQLSYARVRRVLPALRGA